MKPWLLLLCLVGVIALFSTFANAAGSDEIGSNIKAKLNQEAGTDDRRARKYKKRSERVERQLGRARRRNELLRKTRVEREKRHNDVVKQRRQRKNKHAERIRDALQPEKRDRANEKLQWMYKKSMAGFQNIISMDTAQFKEYVMTGPRPYFVFLAYTAVHPSYQCAFCRVMHYQYGVLAQAMHYQHNNKLPRRLEDGAATGDFDEETFLQDSGDNSVIGSGLASNRTAGEFFGWWWVSEGGGKHDFRNYPVFMVEVDIAGNKDLFNILGFKTAPITVLIPPKLSGPKETPNYGPHKIQKWQSRLDSNYFFQQMSQSVAADELSSFIAKHTNIRVNVSPPISWANLIWLILFLAVGCAFLWFFWAKLLTIPWLGLVFLGCGLVFYAFCVGGGMYTYIRDIPFSEQRQDGSHSYIYYSARDQLGAEGYIMGVLQMACGVCAVLAVRTTKNLLERSSSPITKKKSAIVEPALFGLLELPSWAFVLALFLCWQAVLRIYSAKNPGYNNGFLFDSLYEPY